MRVFELDKKLEMTSKVLIGELGKLGIQATNHMSTVSDPDVGRVLASLGKRDQKQVSKRDSKQDKQDKKGTAAKRKGVPVIEEMPQREKKARILIKRRPQPAEVPP